MNRRSVLKSGAIGVTGLAGVSQMTQVWAKPTDSEIEQLENQPNVQAVLRKLGRDKLPDDIEKTTDSLGDGEDGSKIEFWKADYEYGTLHVGAIGNLTNVVLNFNQNFRSKAPEQFQSIPAGTDPLITAMDGTAIVKRSASRTEEKAIRAALPVTGTTLISYTATSIDGFHADVFVDTNETDGITQRRYEIKTTHENTHPVYKDSADALGEIAPDISIQRQGVFDDVVDFVEEGVNTDAVKGIKGFLGSKPWKQIPDSTKKVEDLTKGGIKSIVAASIASETMEEAAGDCGEDCTNCVFSIQSLITDCPKCRIFLTTSFSAIGAASAVLLIVCMWNFCNLPKTINSCSDCIDCAT